MVVPDSMLFSRKERKICCEFRSCLVRKKLSHKLNINYIINYFYLYLTFYLDSMQ